MIFVSLGSQKFQFNRLLIEIDKCIEEGIILEEVFAQIGYSDYSPKYFKSERFLDRQQFDNKIKEADLVITHGGTGAIIGAVKKGKKVIAVPRKMEYGEHVDNHQIQLLDQFDELNLICKCDDVEKIREMLPKAKNTQFNEYKSNTQAIQNSIEEFIENNYSV